MRGLVVGGGAGVVYLGGRYLVDPSSLSSHGGGARIGGLTMILAGVLAAWLVGLRPCVALSARELWVVNVSRTLVIQLAEIREVRPTISGLAMRYWTGTEFGTVDAVAVGQPRFALPPGRVTRAERVAENVRAAVAQAQGR